FLHASRPAAIDVEERGAIRPHLVRWKAGGDRAHCPLPKINRSRRLIPRSRFWSCFFCRVWGWFCSPLSVPRSMMSEGAEPLQNGLGSPPVECSGQSTVGSVPATKISSRVCEQYGV